MNQIAPIDFYEKAFNLANSSQQAAFLKQLFAKDEELRAQFLNFIASSKKDKPAILSFIDLDKYREKVREELSDLSFDMETVYKYFDQGDRSYVPGHEAAWEGAENMLRIEGFEPFTKEAKAFLKKGNLLDGIKILLAMYEGHNDIYEPNYDEEDAFEDYNDNCLDCFKESLQELLPLITKKILSNAVITDVFDVIIKRVKFGKMQYEESKIVDEWRDENIVYDLKVFEPLFLKLLINVEGANYLEELLIKNELKNLETTNIMRVIKKLKKMA